ncbi:MAG: DUF1254 domain-containing protein [Arenicellales bacterium]
MKTESLTKGLVATIVAVSLVLTACTESHDETQSTAPSASSEGTLTQQSIQQYYDELDYQRAVQAYLWSIPSMYMYSLRKSLVDTFGATPNTNVPIWADLMDNETVMLTPNSQVVYVFNYLDLKKDGPTVLEAPPKLAAMLDSMWDQPIVDIGATGPDKGKGGKFLVLPPGYEGDVPEGYFVARSPTYGVMVVLRGYIENGSTKNAVARIKQTRVYPLAKKDNPPKTTFLNVSGKPVDTLFPTDERLFYNLADLVQQEPVADKDKIMYGMLATIGIEKGKTFEPDARMQKILKKAAKTAHGIVQSLFLAPRDEKAWYYPGKTWTLPFQTPNAFFEVENRILLDERSQFFYSAFGTSDGMVKAFVGKGSKYINSYTDKDREFLHGENTYRLVLPANVPVKDFWSLTIYDTETRSMLKNGTRFPNIDSYKKLKTNTDGTIDLYFGPQAPEGYESNWVRTVPGKDWFAMMRFYGPEQAYFDKSWQLNDFEKIK